jgi:drug/metabolite transporter (DMT)-like permease
MSLSKERPMNPAAIPTRRVPRIPTTTGWGLGLAFGAALISGLAIYLNGFAVKQLPDAAVFTTLKNAVAAGILVVVALALARNAPAPNPVAPRHRLGLVLVGVVGGSIPFVLFFSGLAIASAPAAAFIQKTLFVWVAILAVPFLGERLGAGQLVALAVLIVGQALVLPPSGIELGRGETLILIATLLWAVETILVKRLLGTVATPTVAAARMGIGLVVLVGYLAVAGKLGLVTALSQVQWAWALLTGLILAAYVGTWFAALRRAPASAVTSVLVVGAVLTGLLGTIAKGAAPEPSVVGGYVLIAVAAGAFAAWTLRTQRRTPAAVTAVTG